MTSHGSIIPNVDSESSHDSTSKPENATADEESKHSFVRRAEVVANGQVPFPADLPEGEAERLRLEVVRRRRKRFVTFIARAIARDIQNGFQETTRR